MKQVSYKEYKESGVKWFGVVPSHWSIIKLKRIVSVPITDGPHETPEKLNEGIPFVSAEAIKGEAIDFDKKWGFISLEDHKRYSIKYRPKRNDIYVIKSGATTGNVAIVETDADFNIWSPLAAIRVDPRLALARFIFNFLKSKEFQTSVQLGWSFGTQQNIGMNVLENLFLPIPLLSEQKAIATFLDRETERINTLIAKKQKQIEILQRKRAALISQAVTKGLDPNVKMKDSGVEWIGSVPSHWTVLMVKRLTLVKRGASPRPIDDPKYFDENGEYSWVRIADVTASARYLEVTTQKMSALGRSLSVSMQPGDLFLSIAGSVGKPIITKIKCCIHDGFVYFPGLKENREFFYYIFASGKPYVGLGKLGTQLNLNTDTVGGIFIPLPPPAEQMAIVSFLDSQLKTIGTISAKVNLSIEMLQKYRSALISAAVTGKIDVSTGFNTGVRLESEVAA